MSKCVLEVYANYRVTLIFDKLFQKEWSPQYILDFSKLLLLILNLQEEWILFELVNHQIWDEVVEAIDHAKKGSYLGNTSWSCKFLDYL